MTAAKLDFRPLCSTTASSMSGVPLERIASLYFCQRGEIVAGTRKGGETEILAHQRAHVLRRAVELEQIAGIAQGIDRHLLKAGIAAG